LRTTIAILAVLALAFVSASTAEADTFVYSGNIHVGSAQNGGTNLDGKGRQTLQDFSLGLDFTVLDSSGILMSSLGIWDDNGDGLLSAHVLSVYDTDTGDLLASISTAPGGGTLVDGYRYFDLLTGLSLAHGTNFTVAAYYGAGNQDSNGNQGGNPTRYEAAPTFNDIGGAIDNIGLGRFAGGNTFPITLDRGDANRYHAGSFEARPTPEPGTMVLMGSAAAIGGYIRRRRRRKQQQQH